MAELRSMRTRATANRSDWQQRRSTATAGSGSTACTACSAAGCRPALRSDVGAAVERRGHAGLVGHRDALSGRP